ncbi:hypothetical protein SEPCBS57363_004308 [Sporothrix epigloea]|uniref:Uncharacterized protein n=1 Tax=Sporothrix epigloea TaxID=1892477 RepID=A0ABP0DRA5_9PEZI
MASSYLSTARSGGEVAIVLPASSYSVMTASFSFANAPKPNITPADFAPIRRPHPRPWCRIAVPGSSRKIGLRKIWKRIGGIPQSKDDVRYIEGILELRSNGQGPRKIRRTERHVPVWGDAQWAAISPSATESVGKELARALEIVARVDAMNRQSATLEQPKSHVPRKRNSRRQPLDVYMPSSLLPLSSNNSPERLAAIFEHPNEDSEELEEHITKRSERRMSRRVSTLPKIEDSILPSPATTTARSHVFSSPIKRRATERLSEPATPATPTTRAITGLSTAPIAMASPFSRSIKSLTPLSNRPLQEKTSIPDTNESSGMSPVVVFDQSAPKIDTEAAIDVRRRQSLYNSRRREMLSVKLEQKLLGPASVATSGRRHSFVPPETPLAFQSLSKTATSNRRHTFQAGVLGNFFTPSKQPINTKSPEDCSIPGQSIQGPKHTALNFPSSGFDECTGHDAPLPKQDETVVVDARKNPDIFGSGPPVQSHNSPDNNQQIFEMGLVEKSVKLVSRLCERDDQEELAAIAAAPNLITDEQRASAATNQPIDQARNDLIVNALFDVSNDSMEMDPDTSGEDTCAAAEDVCIVSRRPGAELNESLLLPLPETAEAESEIEAVVTANEYGWQSPTTAELEGSNSQRTTHTLTLPAGFATLPLSPAPINIDAHFFSEDQAGSDESDIAEDAELFQDADAANTGESEMLEAIADAGGVFGERLSYTDNAANNQSPAPSAEEEDYAEYTVTQPFNMFNAAGEDATNTMTVDFDAFTQVQLSAHEDSETEMLRNFVTRVKADKTAKAAAAAETAPVHGLAKLQRKRRSGSTGSTALPSGSPMAKKELGGILDSPFDLKPRVPFGEKDHNMSPSPKKKRRAVTVLDSNDENRACNLLSKPLLDDNSPPRPKRRRRKMEADTDSIFNPEFRPSSKEESPAAIPEAAPGPRRSRRTRSQTSIKITASTTATNSALSLIPVRLPGSLNLNGEDGYNFTASSLNLRRNDEKELAATTRINTRKNKGNAEPPCIVVARQSQDTLRSLQAMGQKSTVDLQLRLQNAEKDTDKDEADGDNNSQSAFHKKKTTSSQSAKVVRWAEVLVRFQTTDGEDADKSPAATGLVIATSAVDTEPFIKSALTGSARDSEVAAERQASAEFVVADAPEVASAAIPVAPCVSSVASLPQAGEPKGSIIPRRTTRVSRLQPPTPRTVIASAAAAKAAARSTTAQASAQASAPAGPAPMGLKALPSGSTSARRMAAKRAKIVGMGMAGNGTPAPKRRITRTT